MAQHAWGLQTTVPLHGDAREEDGHNSTKTSTIRQQEWCITKDLGTQALESLGIMHLFLIASCYWERKALLQVEDRETPPIPTLGRVQQCGLEDQRALLRRPNIHRRRCFEITPNKLVTWSHAICPRAWASNLKSRAERQPREAPMIAEPTKITTKSIVIPLSRGWHNEPKWSEQVLELLKHLCWCPRHLLEDQRTRDLGDTWETLRASCWTLQRPIL